MPKPTKSSASSGTRKKNARKAAGKGGAAQPPPAPPSKQGPKLTKKERKELKTQPRQKQYIPPTKPQPAQRDPLETSGLLGTLPPHLVVVLRNLNKKAWPTKIKALEDLRTNWVDKCGEDEEAHAAILASIPVWTHHFPGLLLHSSRRIRMLAISLHAALLQPQDIRETVIMHINEVATPEQRERIVGAWCMAAHDVDRSVAIAGTRTWAAYTKALVEGDEWDNTAVAVDISNTLPLPRRAIFDPDGAFSAEQALTTSDPSESEAVEDMRARLRVGALGCLRWIIEHLPSENEELSDLLHANQLWSCLSTDPDAFGQDQPAVRRAGWTLLQATLKARKGLFNSEPDVLRLILRSSLTEVDSNVQSVLWGPFISFLQEYPQTWEPTASGHESEQDEAEEEEGKALESSTDDSPFQILLTFLGLACGGSPVQGYPTVMLMLSTIPSTILFPDESLSPLYDLFTAFWSALPSLSSKGLAQQRLLAQQNLLTSVVECLAFCVRRWSSLEDQADAEGQARKLEDLIREQAGRAWDEQTSGSLAVKESMFADIVVKEGLAALQGQFFDVAFALLSERITQALASHTKLAVATLKALLDHLTDGARATRAHDLATSIIGALIDNAEGAFAASSDPEAVSRGVAAITVTLDVFGPTLFSLNDGALGQRVDALIFSHLTSLLRDASALLIAYMKLRGAQAAWPLLLEAVAPMPTKRDLRELVRIAEQSVVAAVEKVPIGDWFNETVDELLESATADRENGQILGRILALHECFISPTKFSFLVREIARKLAVSVDNLLQTISQPDLDELRLSTDLLLPITIDIRHALPIEDLHLLSRNLWLAAHLIPRGPGSEQETATFASAKDLYKSLSRESKSEVHSAVTERLAELLENVLVWVRPADIFSVLTDLPNTQNDDELADVMVVFPPSDTLDRRLDALPPQPIDPSLAVLVDTLPPPSTYEDARPITALYDAHGYSSYARIVALLPELPSSTLRALVRQQPWIIRHLIAWSIEARDFMGLPTRASSLFDERALDGGGLVLAAEKVEGIVAYALITEMDDDVAWRVQSARALADGRVPQNLSPIKAFVVDALRRALADDTIRQARIVTALLDHVFEEVPKEEADGWVALVRTSQKTAPETSLAILAAIARTAPDAPRLDRYRNEVAANLQGTSAARALPMVRQLVAMAPNADGGVPILPGPRAVNVMKACQAWIAGDDEEEDEDDEDESAAEDLEALLPLLFTHLAPVLQTVPGAHWGLIFDVMENNMETLSLEDDAALPALARTLRLIIAVRDLATTAKSLRADWQEREKGILALVRDMASKRIDSTKISAPRSACRELLLTVVQDLPPSLIEPDTLSKMCHLVTDTAESVQRMAYQVLQGAAAKRTEHLVIESAVDTEDEFKAELPAELLELLSRLVDPEDAEQDEQVEGETDHSQGVFGHLLAWMLAFDLFEGASMKVRMGYIDQLRSLSIVDTYLMPNIIHMLRLDQGLPRAFKLDQWAIDEFYVSLYESGTTFALPAFAAHIYFRALSTIPSLIASWIQDCKDRSLSATVGTLTATHFSPVIIARELAHVRTADAAADLADENFVVKVAPAVHEVTAAYTVDEHQLEMKMKIPADWPLHKIEMRDVKTVGVDDRRWKSWMLAVQQVLWFQSGHILDGLALFKKNVTLHFEGQVECAICYSIISVMDGSLPKKPCKTCKNRFHAGCLYKWFNTSHSSSCPLCRSNIF
ncbi:hypothetical protein EV715DRAFT_272923 [Schizophyllum commune]